MEIIWFNSYTPEWSWLSNFSPHPVGDFPTAEHAYQAAKYLDPEYIEKIRREPTAAYAKKRGHSGTAQRRPNWEKIKVEVMRRALSRKFEDPELWEKLQATGTAHLIHLSPWDLFWGKNNQGNGDNILGILLMELRHACK